MFRANILITSSLQANENLGAVEIATFLSLVLYGLSLSQRYTFFRRSENMNDAASLKLFVSALLILETFHSFVAGQTIYYDTITNLRAAEPNSYPLSSTVLAETLITLMVQSFFCYRICKLSRNLWSGMSCQLLVVLRFIGGVALCVEAFLDVPRRPNGIFVFTYSWLLTTALTLGAAADVIIAGFLCYYIRRFASPANMKSTTDVINRLVRWSLQTGIITSQASISVIICFQAMSSMVWFAIYIVLAKIYSISLLVSLNARPRNGIEHTKSQRPHLSEIEFYEVYDSQSAGTTSHVI